MATSPGGDGGATGNADRAAPPVVDGGDGTGSGSSASSGSSGRGNADASAVDAGLDADARPPSDAGPPEGGPTVGKIKNPVLAGLNADPQIALFGGRFYIYPTTDGFAYWASTSFSVFSSTDLATWKNEGVILKLGTDVTWAQDRAWAPGIAFVGATYWFYFAAAQQIGVATSTSPIGPFRDALGHALVTTNQYGVQSIDPYVFVDDDGRKYLYFGSGGARVVELNTDMVSFKAAPQNITPPGFREASVAFKRNGIYYFMWSENDTRSVDYRVSYATGTSPMGPFTRAANNPILQKDTGQGILGTGHNSVVQLPNGDVYIAYHRFAVPNGDGTHREVCVDRLQFNADGTIAPVKPTL